LAKSIQVWEAATLPLPIIKASTGSLAETSLILSQIRFWTLKPKRPFFHPLEVAQQQQLNKDKRSP